MRPSLFVCNVLQHAAFICRPYSQTAPRLCNTDRNTTVNHHFLIMTLNDCKHGRGENSSILFIRRVAPKAQFWLSANLELQPADREEEEQLMQLGSPRTQQPV
ncbi:hypothetical protein BaRGS_00023058 [Batillaria attramentaria]|uniref:Uncharacterized protein n=1 Tax=Batillaria attramentaria TaxID=370345 RepID=A0ABD0KFD3_9CAEN